MATLLEKRSEALDTLDEWQELLTHFEISGHTFAYFPVLVPDESWAEVCQNKLSDYLSAQDKKLHILAFDNPEDFKLLTVRIFAETFAPNTEAVWITTPIPFDNEQLEVWKQAWRESMARLNQFRNKLTKNYPYTFLFVGGTWTHEITFNIAPDLWSIHSGIIRINPPLLPTSDDKTRGSEPVRAEDKPDKFIDTEFALRQAERLRGKKGAEVQFANLLLNASKLLIDKVEFRRALEISAEAVLVYERLVNVQNRQELLNNLAGSYNNKGISLDNLGRLNEAIVEYNKAIEILKNLVGNGRSELLNDLAMVYLNKGVSLDNLGRLDEAIAEYDKAIEIRKELVENGRSELSNDLAAAYLNKGVSLRQLGRLNEAIAEYDKAIEIRKELVENGRSELSNELAIAYLNKGNALDSLSRLSEAIEFYDDAINLWEQMLKNGYAYILPNLEVGFGNLINTNRKARNSDLADKAISRLHELLEFAKKHKESEHLSKSI